nr:DJ-1/PfpI family protein [Gammaproteobacteria bacterium]
MSEPAHPAPIERPLVVAIAYDELCMFEFSIAVEIFGLPRPEMGDRWYDFKVAAVSAGPLRATGGVQVSADGDLDLVRAAHTVVIPGWTGVETTVPDELKQALLAAYANGARIMSICSGVFVLASTGLLDGRRATTHWRYMESLAAKYPDIIVQRDVLYVDEDQLLTSAGSAAGIDLSLHLVRRDFGVAAANSVARRLVVPAHRDGGQAQFTERPVAKYPNHSLGDLFDWMRQHLDQPLTIKTLAQRASTSPRSLLRRFV